MGIQDEFSEIINSTFVINEDMEILRVEQKPFKMRRIEFIDLRELLAKGVKMELDRTKPLFDFVSWYSSCEHADHCEKKKDPKAECTCGVDNAKEAIKKYRQGFIK